MKKLSLLIATMILLLLAVIPSFSTTPTYAFSSVDIDTSTSSATFELGYYNNSDALFYEAGLLWLFTLDGTVQKFWTSTDNGATWSVPTTIRAGSQYYFNVWILPGSAEVSYTYADGTDGHALYYRKGTMNDNATITWLDTEQTAVGAVGGLQRTYSIPFEDGAGNAYIFWQNRIVAGSVYATYVSKSSTDNGTWTDAGVTNVGAGHRLTQEPNALQLSANKCYVAGAENDSKSYGWLLSGGVWGAAETIATTQKYTTSICKSGTDALYAAYRGSGASPPFCIKERSAAGVWGSEVSLSIPSAAFVGFTVGPRLSYLSATGNLMMIASDAGSSTVYYKLRTSGTWDTSWTEVVTLANACDTITAIQQTGTPSHYGIVTFSDADNKLIWHSYDLPTCSTMSAQSVGVTHATLRGLRGSYELLATSTLVQYRFQYGLTAAYGSATTWTDFGVPALFTENLSSFVASTTYHFRAEIRTELSTGWGADATFTTYANAGDPTGLTAIPIDGESIGLSWVVGAGATQSILRYSVGNYPADYTAGTSAYFGELASYTLTGLTPGTTYYFRVWGYDGPIYYSTNYSEAAATTYATSGAETFPPGTDPNTVTPSTTILSGVPGFSTAEWLGTVYMTDVGVVLRLVAMVGMAIVVVGIAAYTDSILITILATIIGSALLFTLGLIPWYLMLLYVIIGGGVAFPKEAR